MEKRFEIYVNEVVNKLDCSEKEKLEIAEEMNDHLVLLKREFIEKGFSEGDAVELAISTFGNQKEISNELQGVMFPYIKVAKWLGVAVCALLSVLMINKGINLWNMSTNVDGAGIGIHFLIFEINDRVPEQSIPSYAIGFFIASLLTALVPIVVLGKKILYSKT